MKKSRKKNPNRTVGKAFVGRWNNGQLGWSMPEFLYDGSRRAETPIRKDWNTSLEPGTPHFLCKVTVELIKDKLGRPIVKYLKPKKG